MFEAADLVNSGRAKAVRPQDGARLEVEAAFERGDFHAAATSNAECWQKFAALGMLGITAPAIEGLRHFDGARPAFYRAAALWMDHQEHEALNILRGLDLTEAAELARLIQKPTISVLGQLPYYRRAAPHTLLEGIAADTKFRVANHSFNPADRPSRPESRIRDWYQPDDPPDFYICNMLEWHFPPFDIHEAPFPIFAQTADTDLHIQLLRRWLPSFDAIFVSDTMEHAMVSQLLPHGRTAAVPSSFSWLTTPETPPVQGHDRPIDVFMSGIMLRALHPDKARLLVKVLKGRGLNVFIIDGHARDRRQYLRIMSYSKATLCYTRNQGAMVTRGIDALGMGCIPIIPKDNVLKLCLPQHCGFEYEQDFSDVAEVVRAAVDSFERSDPHQRAEQARKEFEQERPASTYMRNLVVHAALTTAKGKSNRRYEPLRDFRRNTQYVMWPIPYEPAATMFFNHNLSTFRARLKAKWNSEAANNLARELILRYAEATRQGQPGRPSQLRLALRILDLAIRREPQRLVLWLNYIRAAYFLGDDRLRERAREKLTEALRMDAAFWSVSVHDDVLPPDVLDNMLDYRRYLEALMRVPVEQDADEAGVEDELKRTILASFHWLAGWLSGNEDEFAVAYRLNPDHSVIALDFVVSQLRRDGRPPDAVIEALRALMSGTYLFPHVASIILAHRDRLRGRLDEGEIESCLHLARVFDERIMPIETFNYTRGIGVLQFVGERTTHRPPPYFQLGPKSAGLVLCEFEPPAFAPESAIRELEELPFARLTRVAPFLHPGLPLAPKSWRYVIGNTFGPQYSRLQDEAVAESRTDVDVVVYDPVAFVRDFKERMGQRIGRLTGFETIVMATSEEGRPWPKIVGFACSRHTYTLAKPGATGDGTEGLFDPYEYIRRLRLRHIPFELWTPANHVLANFAIPKSTDLLSANRCRYLAAITPVEAPAQTSVAATSNDTRRAWDSVQQPAKRVQAALERARDGRLLRHVEALLFDAKWYLAQYPDVAASGMTPLEHYRRIGAAARRDPHPLFDGQWYAACNPDVAAANTNPLQHFIQYGGFEGRSPNPFFDSAWYLAKYPDVAASHVNPLFHYIRHGVAEGRDPNPVFDTDWYLAQYPEVGWAGLNPLAHYFRRGLEEGYRPNGHVAVKERWLAGRLVRSSI